VTRSTGKLIDGYSHYSNDVDLWQKPILIAELNTRTGVEQGDALVDSGIFIPKNKKNNDP
ncbi:MAG: hypothetical protein J6K98_00810, partial [Clostridia bacterium]|nr:hypothetical protein [Clostridia bacterium]